MANCNRIGGIRKAAKSVAFSIERGWFVCEKSNRLLQHLSKENTKTNYEVIDYGKSIY